MLLQSILCVWAVAGPLQTIRAAQIPLQAGKSESPASNQPDERYFHRFHVSSSTQAQELIRSLKAANADVLRSSPIELDARLEATSLSTNLSKFNSSIIQFPPFSQASISTSSSAQSGSWNLKSLGTSFHSSYHRFEEVLQFANDLAFTFPHQVELIRLGQSSQDREVLAINIQRPNHREAIPRVVIVSSQHARDWVATATTLYLAHALVVPSHQSGSLNDLLDSFAFTIIPVSNPDGYAYTWETDRLWYKNRMPVVAGNECVGLDMNRNWGFHWESDPQDPCHHWYGGAHAFEAPEVNAIAAFIERTSNIQSLLDLRSYGQIMMYPFSYTCEVLPGRAENLIELALGAAKATRSVHGTAFTSGAACEMLYSAPGSILDWAYASQNIPFSYSIFLRDTGSYGFMLPSEYIRPSGEETARLLHYTAKWLEDNANK